MDNKEIWERMASVEAGTKSAHHRIDRIEHIADAIHSLASEMREMRNDFGNVIKRVDVIEKRPVKRYETIVNSIITAVAGGIAGYIISAVL